MRRRAPLPLAAAALAASGAAALAAGSVSWGDPVLRLQRETPVNVGAGDRADISAHNSPSLARDPTDPDNLAVASRIDSPDFSCALHVSRDGGRTWRRTRVPIPPGAARKCYAPDVAFDAGGRLHVSFVTLRGAGNVPSAVWVASSDDAGRTLRPPRRVAGELAFQVRLAADPRDARRLYLTWLQAAEVGSLRFPAPGNPIVVARSDDRGRSWQPPVAASSPARERVLAPTPAVGARGELYVLYLDAGADRLDYEGGHEGFGGPPYRGRHALVLARSGDGGRSWAESVVDARVRPVERFVAFLPAFPALAIDRASGRILAAYHDRRTGDADVWLWSLDPGAARWRGPLRVNDTRRGDGTTQRLPQVAVAPGGRVDVVYYDRRGDRGDRRTEVSLQSSFDGARSFGPRRRLSRRAFDARIGLGNERGMPELGSRLGLQAADAGALAVWSDTRSGTEASLKQDLFLAAAGPVVAGVAAREALRRAGFALLAGAATAAVILVVRRRRVR